MILTLKGFLADLLKDFMYNYRSLKRTDKLRSIININKSVNARMYIPMALTAFFCAFILILVAWQYTEETRTSRIKEAVGVHKKTVTEKLRRQIDILHTSALIFSKEKEIAKLVKAKDKKALQEKLLNFDFQFSDVVKNVNFSFFDALQKPFNEYQEIKNLNYLQNKKIYGVVSGLVVQEGGLYILSVAPIYIKGELVGYMQAHFPTNFIGEFITEEKNIGFAAIYFDPKDTNHFFPNFSFLNDADHINNKIKQDLDLQRLKSDSCVQLSDLCIIPNKITDINNVEIGYLLIIKSAEDIKGIANSIKDAVMVKVVAILVFSSLAGILLFIFLNKTITIPINILSEQIENYINGIDDYKFEFQSNTSLEKRQDEIGDIANIVKLLSEKTSTLFNALRKSQRQSQQYIEAINQSNIVSRSDLEGNITYINDEFTKITGWTKREVIGKPHSIFRHPSVPKETFKDFWETIQAGKVWHGVVRSKKKNGDDFYAKVSIVPIFDENRKIIEYIGIRQDITDLINIKEEVSKTFYVDFLTNLGNRFKLKEDLEELKEASLAVLDISGFKKLNDVYGFDFGDKLLVDFASFLFKRFETPTFHVYRIHADEFAILTNPEEISYANFLKNLKEMAKDYGIKLEVENKKVDLVLTIGIAHGNKNILNNAELAHQIAKNENKQLVEYSSKIKLNDEYKNSIALVSKIKSAIKDDRIEPFFQPIVDNKTQQITKYECLIRMVSETGEIVPPYLFLTEAKKTRFYPELTRIMINKTFEIFSKRKDIFSVNLSSDDIMDEKTIKAILLADKKFNVLERTVFEIVESESIQNFEAMKQFITKFKRLGSKIAIDDFGTGYSNFEYLTKMHPDFLKIDGSMIKNIDTDPTSFNVVETIVSFAKKNKILTIAEFVHSKEVYEIVVKMGIDFSQGYYFGEPKRFE